MPERKASVLIVDDEEKLRRYLRKELERKGYAACDAADRDGALRALAGRAVDVVLLDIVLPGASGMEILAELRREQPELQVIMLTGNAAVESAVRAMKLGAYDYLPKPYQLDELLPLVDRAFAKARLTRENRSLRLELARHRESRELIGASAALQELRAALERLAPAASPLLLEGEAGTGKELAARLLHSLGPRAEEPFLVVDCGASEDAALERDLLGSDGLLALAGRGTVYLDDIEALGAPLQAGLLRLLDAGEGRARLVAATRADLGAAVRDGAFRAELYYRFGVSRVRMPPLRERPEDIPALAAHFLARLRARAGRGPEAIEPEALARLSRYPWPGNARQLEEVVERAALRAGGARIADAAVYLPRNGDGPCEEVATLAAVERSHILKVLAEAGGNRGRAAAVLGVDPKTLYNKLKRYQAGP